ncbi:MAG: hypothetical protein IPK67_15360 [Planctomycetes bacterium]|nr:hypothetical protein [Planctomycetota bacterium]
MSSLRLWILMLAVTAFGAGIGVGWLAGSRVEQRAGRARAAGPFTGFQHEFERTFQVSPERAKLLAELLECYQREIAEQEQAQLDRSRADLEGQLAKTALTYRRLIRDSVLSPEQRPEYDRLAAGVEWKATN